MFKIKNISSASPIIKFYNQNELNYRSVEIIKDLQNKIVLPFSLSVKRSKAVIKYNTDGYRTVGTYLNALRNSPDLEAKVFFILKQIFFMIDHFAQKKINPDGILFGVNCIYISSDDSIRVIYVPGNEFTEEYSVFTFVKDLSSYFADSKYKYGVFLNSVELYNAKGIEAFVNYIDGFFCNNGINRSANEGETTVLSNNNASVSMNEGETTVLGNNNASVSMNEGETTVLSNNNASVSVNEGETTLLNRDNIIPGDMRIAVSSDISQLSDNEYNESLTVMLESDDESSKPFSTNEGETTVLSNKPVNSISDYISDIKTSYGRNDAKSEGTHIPTLMRDGVPVESKIEQNVSDDQSYAMDFSESETTMPGINDPLNVTRTLIGVDGLAKSMSNVSIGDDSGNSAYDTILMQSKVPETSAFFIRFVNSQAIFITKNYFTIGTGKDMDYTIQGNALVSRYHATIVIENNKYFIIDNNSTNKTYIDGKEAVPFEKNEIITGTKVVLANEIFDFYVK